MIFCNLFRNIYLILIIFSHAFDFDDGDDFFIVPHFNLDKFSILIIPISALHVGSN